MSNDGKTLLGLWILVLVTAILTPIVVTARINKDVVVIVPTSEENRVSIERWFK